jgi:hypothetical protein
MLPKCDDEKCAKLGGVITCTIVHREVLAEEQPLIDPERHGVTAGRWWPLTWSPDGQTTIVGAASTTSPGQGFRPKKWTEYDSTGTVTGGTST